MKIKYLPVFFLSIFIRFDAWCQSAPANISNYDQMAQMLPPPPNAASLGKYGGQNVNLSSGAINISIPLLTYSSKSIQVPVSLSYTSNGVPVDQIASRTGMGWNLNCGGVITRTAYGNIDDGSTGGAFPTPSASSNLLYWMDAVADPTNIHAYTQPDIFTFNFNGYSGKFILDTTQGVVKMQGNPVMLNYSALKIQTLANGSNFKITTPDGVQYFFGSAASTESSYAYPTGGGCTQPYNSNSGTAFYLNTIIHPNNDTVNFIYSPITYDYKTSTSETIYKLNIDDTYLGTGKLCLGTVITPAPSLMNTTCLNWLQTQGVLLQEVNSSSGGKIKFSYTSRSDCTDMLISGIQVFMPGATTPYKTFALAYQNSYSGTAYTNQYITEELKYRPFLTSVTENSADGLTTKTHTFTYNDINSLPPRLSFAKDDFGFFNGQNNTTLIPVPSGDPTYQLAFPSATANRSVNPLYSAKGLLTSIVYPTGGKDSIEYESNQITTQVTIPPPSASIQASAYNPTISQGSTVASSGIAVATIDQVATLTASCSSTSTSQTNLQTANVYFTDQTTGAVILNQTLTYNQSLSQKFLLNASHSYQIQVTSTGAQVTGAATLSYLSGPNTYLQNQTVNAAGLRVLRVVTTDNVTGTSSVKRYYYNTFSNPVISSGTSVVQPQYTKLLRTRQQCSWDGGQDYSCYPLEFDFYTMYSNSVFPLYYFGPVPTYYSGVTESDGENYDNGGIEHSYSTASDFLAGNYYGDPILGAPVTSFDFRRGRETYRGTFKMQAGGKVYVKKVFTHFTEDPRVNHAIDAYIVNKNFKNVTTEPGCDPVDIAFSYGQYNLSHYLVYQTWVYPDTVKTWTYDNAGQNYLEDKMITAYGNPAHALPTQVTYYSSDGGLKVQNNVYPADITLSGSAETARQALLARQISPALQQTVTKSIPPSLNSTPVFSLNTIYNVFPNGLVLPQTKQVQIAGNPIESRIQFNSYDNKGNILDENKVSGSHISYQWGYNNLYPVAEVKNATVNDIFYDSFEEGDGNSALGTAKTGHYSYNGATTPYSKILNNVDPGGYTLSYWSLGTGGNWSLVSSTVTVPANSTSYTISLTGQIDDVRFYPVGAQMTTYTYDPLIGMTSSADEKSEITYYEYDSFQRLMNIKDKDGNVIKHVTYHFHGQ